MLMKLLLIEDDANLAKVITSGLEENGYVVNWESNGKLGSEMALAYTFDVIILDIMLPELDGFAVCHKIRSNGNQTPIIMLTARYQEADRVRGLNCGADDYLVKPFSFPELLARLRALLRRANNQHSPSIKLSKLTLNTVDRRAFYDGREIELTAKEYGILEYLVLNKNCIITKNMIEEHIWESESDIFSNVIEVLISRIRKKLDNNNKNSLIKTVKGLGYIIEDK
ncbi:MAG: DNA-binding response regulator [Dehalococcoides mccartyi]|uniref:response regulator transcription factor n=2 Tax=Dehalococcoides mccartyi TaxID=61435 RepID=UPI0029D9B6AF|nr:response regulator transcription factor [Dehalococcoides mccartyi]MCF7635835.1 DNA-binding response regulator [Dehalococcoides mccartyi]MEA2121597.1 Transcriptional activator protein CzcR [Dehalococcoides mccartyi]MEA2122604.1 Transcriptional activator protein CzcR [Dehalococcoides mccartyi]